MSVYGNVSQTCTEIPDPVFPPFSESIRNLSSPTASFAIKGPSSRKKVMAAEHSPEEQEERGFVISDKRLFTPSGERIMDTGQPDTAEPESPPPP